MESLKRVRDFILQPFFELKDVISVDTSFYLFFSSDALNWHFFRGERSQIERFNLNPLL